MYMSCISSETSLLRDTVGYSEGTVGAQWGYSEGTVWGYSEGTVGVQRGYSEGTVGGTVRVQRGYSWDTGPNQLSFPLLMRLHGIL